MKNKKISLEILRIISCFFVVVSHTNTFLFNDISVGGFTWFMGVAYYILSKVAVPVFFMISGALYLSKEYSHKEMLKRCLYRLLLPLFAFSAIIYFKRVPIISIDNILGLFKDFLGNKILGNYWFLYVLLGLYIATPFLQKMCKNMKKEDYNYFLVYTLIFVMIIQNLKHYNIITLAAEFSIPLISVYIAYYILGHYFINFDINLSKKKEIILIILTILTIFIGTIMTYVEQVKLNMQGIYYGNFSTLTVFIPSICMVYFMKKIDKKVFSEKFQKVVMFFSGATFGVYLTHGILLGHTKFIYDFLGHTLNINLFISIVIYQIILTLTLSIIIAIAKKIPIIKNIF